MNSYRVILKNAPDQVIQAHGWNIDSNNETFGFFIEDEDGETTSFNAIFTMASVVGVIEE